MRVHDLRDVNIWEQDVNREEADSTVVINDAIADVEMVSGSVNSCPDGKSLGRQMRRTVTCKLQLLLRSS